MKRDLMVLTLILLFTTLWRGCQLLNTQENLMNFLDTIEPNFHKNLITARLGGPSLVSSKIWHRDIDFKQILWVYEPPDRSYSSKAFIVFVDGYDFPISVSGWNENLVFKLTNSEIQSLLDGSTLEYKGKVIKWSTELNRPEFVGQ